jgi:hypothetical protein
MKQLTVMLLAALFLAPAAALAASASKSTPDPKQTARCNSEAQAKGLKRADRKAFLKTCMAGVANATAAPQSVSGSDKPALETAKP